MKRTITKAVGAGFAGVALSTALLAAPAAANPWFDYGYYATALGCNNKGQDIMQEFAFIEAYRCFLTGDGWLLQWTANA